MTTPIIRSMPVSATMTSIRTAITRFDKAAQEFAFIGSQMPENHHEIEREYKAARQSLERMIERNLK